MTTLKIHIRHLASILGRIDADDRRRVPGERRSGRIIELSVRGKVESIHAVDQPTINNLYSSTTQQTDTDRQTDKIQLTNTSNTKLKPKVTKCQLIHAVHFCHCA